MLPLIDIFALLAFALVLAKILGGLAEKVHIPAVLAELTTGVLIGNLLPFTPLAQSGFAHSEVVHALSELGVLILLFLVGLETDLDEMAAVGLDSLLVALAGVIVPFILAFAIAERFFAGLGVLHTVFLAAALTATSVGITARVLRDSGRLTSISGRIILGAAVIDDVLGILILAAISAMATQGSVSVVEMGGLFAKVFILGGGFFAFGKFLLPPTLRFLQRLDLGGSVVVFAFSLCLIAAWITAKAELAGIVGAFAMGVTLDNRHFKGFHDSETLDIETLLKPIADIFTPIFFVVMGMQVDLSLLGNFQTLEKIGVLTGCAILGKIVCGWAILPQSKKQGADRLLIGLGMIPRGEVGLIFATMGLTLKVLDESDYAAVVSMVAITTLLAPVLLAWRTRQRPKVNV